MRRKSAGALDCPLSHPAAAPADTPGYAVENETKPAICKAVNAALGSELFTPEKVRPLCFAAHRVEMSVLAARSGAGRWVHGW